MDHGQAVLMTVVLAVGAGLLAQILAHHWHVPAIVLLLGLGIILGEDVLGLIRPDELEGGLNILVKLAVAIILFEGALNLNLKSLRQSMVEVRNLVTIGVVVSAVLTTLLARFVAGLDWQIALLFGSLMTVTGPTVVQPLMRRISVTRQVRTILEGEAILIDPIGAILAIAMLDFLLVANTRGVTNVADLLWAYFGRLLVGGVVGVLGALVLSRLIKARRLVPDELNDLVALACVWVTFGLAEWVQSEAGIMAVVVMGLIVQQEALPGKRQLRRFKEKLTTLGISLIFILLAAKLEIGDLVAEGFSGLMVVLLIMFVARPAAVFLSTTRTSLNWRQKLFIAWVGPRGIIAASVASIFAVALFESRVAGGERLLALTFLTILGTVTVQGLSAGWVARLLGLQSMEGQKAIVVGTNPLGCRIAGLLQSRGRPTLLVDTNLAGVERARMQGLTAMHGNALEEETLENLHAEEAATLLAVTSNSEVNVLACQVARDTFGIERAFPVLGSPVKGANPELLKQTGGNLAFGSFVNLSDWEYPGKDISEFTWVVDESWPSIPLSNVPLPVKLLPVIRVRGQSTEIVHAEQTWKPGDQVVMLSTMPEADAREIMESVGQGADLSGRDILGDRQKHKA